jgi:hAT family C-terminal dimerisation region
MSAQVTLPTTHTVLTILATLPVYTAEAQRTFSKVERTLTTLRNTISEERLHALILLQAHRDLWPSTDAIIHKYILSDVGGRRRTSSERFVTTRGVYRELVRPRTELERQISVG